MTEKTAVVQEIGVIRDLLLCIATVLYIFKTSSAMWYCVIDTHETLRNAGAILTTSDAPRCDRLCLCLSRIRKTVRADMGDTDFQLVSILFQRRKLSPDLYSISSYTVTMMAFRMPIRRL